MPNHPYTVRDTPQVVARIQRDMDRVTEVVRAADRGLKSLVLTGGFARGEGAVVDGMPQNDYDLVAIRSSVPRRVDYGRLQAQLEQELGLHVDLAPVAAWRLPWVGRTIFWYETALIGRTLWGEHMLDRVPIREPKHLKPTEGLRLLVNRAAGLLLYTEADAHQRRLQASKALLAAADAHLLASGHFPPTQTDRRRLVNHLCLSGRAHPDLQAAISWVAWAYHFKVDPSTAPERDPHEAWTAAARAVLQAVPVALRFAGFSSLEAYERHDGWIDRIVYYRRAGAIHGARRWVPHPTGRVRVATLRLLEASLDGRVQPEAVAREFGSMVKVPAEPLKTLRSLRAATLQ